MLSIMEASADKFTAYTAEHDFQFKFISVKDRLCKEIN